MGKRWELVRFNNRGKVAETVATILEEKIPLCADHVTVVSETIRQRALGIGIPHEKISKIPNGANIDSIKPLNMFEARKQTGLPEDKKILCFVGNFLVSFDLLLQSFKIVLKSYPDTRLILISKLKEEHLRKIHSLNLSHVVILAGVKPYAELPLYTRSIRHTINAKGK